MGDEYINDNNQSDSNQSTIKLNTSTDISLYANLSLKLFTSYDDNDDEVIITFDNKDNYDGFNKTVKNNNNTENNQLNSFNNHDDDDDDDDVSVHEMNINKVTISEACRTVTVLIDLLIYIIRTSVNLLSNWKMNFYLQLVSLIYEHLYW